MVLKYQSFLIVPTGVEKEDTVIQYVEARDGAKCPTMSGTAPSDRNSAIPSVRGAHVNS